MKATVSVLYHSGVKVPRTKKPLVIENASVSLSSLLHPVLNRLVTQLIAVDDNGRHLAEPLFDATCTAISADGLVFRGWELGSSQREQMQEWFVRPAVGDGYPR